MEREERFEKKHAMAREEIKQAAWAQLSSTDAGSLSLRGVAASLGFSPAALYRYFPSKNNLVTALVIDAFASLASSQEAVLDSCDGQPWDDCLRALGYAYRAWAKANQAAFLLIFGNPIAGWDTPWQETMPTAGTALRPLLHVLQGAHIAGDLKLPLAVPASRQLAKQLKEWSDAVHRVNPEILYLGFITATRLQGLMLVELGRQLPPFFTDGEQLFKREIERIIMEIHCSSTGR